MKKYGKLRNCKKKKKKKKKKGKRESLVSLCTGEARSEEKAMETLMHEVEDAKCEVTVAQRDSATEAAHASHLQQELENLEVKE